jgi:hypothetical protein
MIQCLLLKSQDLILISKVEQVETDPLSGEPNCKLIDPARIFFKMVKTDHKYDDREPYTYVLESWPEYGITDQKEVMIHSDAILTIVEPGEKLVKAYEDFIKE